MNAISSTMIILISDTEIVHDYKYQVDTCNKILFMLDCDIPNSQNLRLNHSFSSLEISEFL